MTETEQKQSQSVKVNLDDLDGSLVQEVVVINPDANPFAAPPPPDDGTHRVRLTVVDDSWEHSETKPNKSGVSTAFIKFKLSGQIIAEGSKNNNKRVFDSVNTLVFDGKSRLAGILVAALGGTPEAKATVGSVKNYVDLAKLAKRVLSGEPIVRVVTKWRAQRKVEETSKYETVLSGQKNFPRVNPADPNSEYNPVLQDKKSGSEIRANAEIQEYLPDVGA